MGILDGIATGGLTTIISTGLEIINKFIEDPDKKIQAQLQMLQLTQTSEFKQMDGILQEQQGQVDINKIEAASDSLFKSGWRPYVGWGCGTGFVMQVVVFPMLVFIGEIFGRTLHVPDLGSELLYSTLFGMLGIGGMRSFDKWKERSK